jgi:hypothetical protein
MADEEDIPLEASAALLSQDHVTLKFTSPETGAVVGRMKFTVIERDDDGLPARLAIVREHYREPR